MNWKKYPKSVEELKRLCKFDKKLGRYLSNPEIATELKSLYPGERIAATTIKDRKYRLGITKEKTPTLSIVNNSSEKNNDNDDESQVLKWLQKEELSIGEMSRRLHAPYGVSKEYVIKILDNLRKQGYEVDYQKETHQVKLERELKKSFEPIDIKPLYRNSCKILLLGDTHMVSKCQQLSLLHTAYKIGEDEEVAFALHGGDIQEGDGTVYRGQKQEIFLPIGTDVIRDYVVENYPKTKAFKTYVLGGGNHDWIWMKNYGYNMVKNICEKRKDLVYRGDVGARFTIKGLTFETLHPSGGVGYARSYRLQRIIEGAIGDVLTKVRNLNLRVQEISQFFVAGHLHVALWFPYMSYQAFLVPCLQSQTDYLKAKGLFPEVGFFIVKAEFDDKGNVNKLTHQYYNFNGQIKEQDY